MSIIIKGMEMPTSCQHCFASDDENRFCRAAIEYIPMLGKPNFCPLVPVPTPHGRLIDADAIDVIGYCGIPQRREDTFDDGVMWLAEQIDLLPTIIPAEEGVE